MRSNGGAGRSRMTFGIVPRGQVSTVDYEGFKAARRFPALDGIRAIAVMLVMTLHAGAHSDFFLWSIVDGQKGVPIFFVLSGFLITTLLVRELESRGRVSLKAFYVRRIMRLAPLYYLVLGVYVVLIFASNMPDALARKEELARRLPYLLFYTAEYAPFNPKLPVFGHAWSLGIEEKFYLAWPAFAFVLLSRHRARIAAAVVLAVVLSVLASFHLLDHILFFESYGALFVGCALALLLNDPRGFERLKFLGARSVQAIVFALAIPFQMLPILQGVRNSPLYPVAAAIVIASAAIGERSIGQRFLSSRTMVYIGQRSYAVYLIHVLATHVVDRVPILAAHTTAAALATFAAILALSLLVAEVLYRLIEGPGIRWAHEWSAAIQGSRPMRAPANPSAAAD
jgi:peptidoglycan/LPS O-acetylase OafA/YrhL